MLTLQIVPGVIAPIGGHLFLGFKLPVNNAAYEKGKPLVGEISILIKIANVNILHFCSRITTVLPTLSFNLNRSLVPQRSMY